MHMQSSSSSSLPKEARLFVRLQVLFNSISLIVSLFVNTFLLKSFGSFSSEVLLYNAIISLTQPIAMLTTLKLSVRRNSQFIQRISFLFYGLVLTVLCTFGETVSFLYPLFAIMISFGGGYYYSVYSSQMLCYTTDQNRDKIAGLIAIFGSAISVSLPLLSGYLITTFDSYLGYQIVFGISALLAVGALLTTTMLPPLTQRTASVPLINIVKILLGDPRGRWILIANGLDNCIGSTVTIFVTLLFYSLIPNEWLISLNSSIGSIAGFLGASLYYRIVRAHNRTKCSLFAACAILVPCIGMLFDLNITIILIFQATYSLFIRFLASPVLNTHFKVVESLGLHEEFGAEVHLVRELFVSTGHLIGLALIYFTPKTNTGAAFVLGTMMIFAMISVILLRKIDNFCFHIKKCGST